ncbi:MAG TPA: hypothetical protein VLG50_04040 [Candidatus Saccharimonadales bacterium]|nr:hypothetical protein [Candidatus Saccharimonadales bacterium]
MKLYVKIILKALTLITLFCLQLCILRYEQSPVIQPLLIAYAYSLFTNASIITLAILMFFLDCLTLIYTGMAGLTFIFLTPLSWFLLKTKKDLYNKVAGPCFLIFSYELFYALIFFLFLKYPIHPLALLWATFVNSFIFIALWKMAQQPFHD